MTLVVDESAPVQIVHRDLYRDIHKGIRAELFRITEEAGSLDPTDAEDRGALVEDVKRLVVVLRRHAVHEDGAVQPVLETVLPDLARSVDSQHVYLDARIGALGELVAEIAEVPGAGPDARREQVRRAYLEIAAFTSGYLAHQDFEERIVMPRLEAAVGDEAVAEVHRAVLAAVTPEDMARTLPLMLPALNLEDRVEFLGAIRSTAPAPVFDRVWGLARTALAPIELAKTARRLGMA